MTQALTSTLTPLALLSKKLVEPVVQASLAPESRSQTMSITSSVSACPVVFTTPSPQPTRAVVTRLKSNTPPPRGEGGGLGHL